MIIKISERFKDDYITREAGEELRELIYSSEGDVEIDFSDLKIASASFFDEGIAKLDKDKILSKKVSIKNLFRKDFELLINVCKSRNLSIENLEIFERE